MMKKKKKKLMKALEETVTNCAEFHLRMYFFVYL